jgi:hypothetical protein
MITGPGAAERIALEFPELPLTAHQPQRIVNSRLHAGSRITRGALRFQPRVRRRLGQRQRLELGEFVADDAIGWHGY